jgi:hypothetical protein
LAIPRLDVFGPGLKINPEDVLVQLPPVADRCLGIRRGAQRKKSTGESRLAYSNQWLRSLTGWAGRVNASRLLAWFGCLLERFG